MSSVRLDTPRTSPGFPAVYERIKREIEDREDRYDSARVRERAVEADEIAAYYEKLDEPSPLVPLAEVECAMCGQPSRNGMCHSCTKVWH